MAGKTRESNIELLRIVSMMMVLVVHMDGASLGLPKNPHWGMAANDVWRLAVESAVIIGVNCFTLISGYFGIRLRLRSVVVFLFQCVFYSVLIATAGWIVNPAKYGAGYWGESWLVLTHTDLWYVPAYFALMLLSPFVNRGMESMSRRENVVLTGVFVLFNLWAGWLWDGKFNPTGYTVIQLLMVYMIGRVIAMFRRPGRRWIALWLAIYIVATVGIYLSCFILPIPKAFAYNSPLVLLSSVGFFMIFLGMRFKSRGVNFLAKSAFAVYLVHKAPVVWVGYFKPFMLREWNSLSLGEFSLLVAGMAIGSYLAVVLPDLFRRKLADWFIKRVFRQNNV